MKHSGYKNMTCLTGAALALLLSWSVMGSMITGLRLAVPETGKLFLLCAAASGLSALCFRFRRGGTVLLCALVPVSWVLSGSEAMLGQTLGLLGRIAVLCDGAYGWGVPGFLRGYGMPASVLYPMAVLGCLTAVGVALTVCRGRSLLPALLGAGIPFALCFLVTDTVPDTRYLYLWMLGMALVVLPQGVRREDGTQGVTLTVMTALPAALALGLLLWLTPREEYDNHPEALRERIVNWAQELPQLWEETAEDVASALSGVVQPSEVNLRTLGPRNPGNYPVMEVTAPQSGTLYLRGQDYDLYDGTGWTATRHRTESSFSPAEMTSVGNVEIRTRRVRDVLYLPYYPGNNVILTGGCLDNGTKEKAYSFTQWVLPEDWRSRTDRVVSSSVETLEKYVQQITDEKERQRYLTLPNETRKWAADLLEDILTEERSAADVADAVGTFVRNAAGYDLNTSRMPAGTADFARWFLEESETGYCVHFATAATVLLRAAGVEARYVEGYMLQAVAGEAVTVSEKQAHAWTEYFDPAMKLWIVLEATPPDGSSRTEAPEASTRPSMPRDPAEEDRATQPDQTVPQTEPPAVLPGFGDHDRRADLSWLGTAARWLLALGLMWCALVGQRLARLAHRRRRQDRGGANARTLEMWRELELLHRLEETPPPEQMRLLAQRAKYSRHTITEPELQAMARAAEAVRLRLKQRPWYQKAVFAVIFAAF